MRESKQTITKLLIAFADAMNSMDEREFDLLIAGKAKLRLVEDRPHRKAKPVEDMRIDKAVSDMAERLREIDSREDAETLMASIDVPRKKNFLLMLSRNCGVNVGSKDNIPRIEQKLIEHVVGSKLRSEAIRKVVF